MSMDSGLRNKWSWVVALAWVMAGISVVASIWLAFTYGVYEQRGLNDLNQMADLTKINATVMIACAAQALASILAACLFSMINSIYQTAIDVWSEQRTAIGRK